MLLGATLASLPPHYETVAVMGSPYYYADGVYYVQSGSQHRGAGARGCHRRASSSAGHERLREQRGPRLLDGAYYKQQPAAKEGADPTYKVVAPPLGATVETLPKDAKEQVIAGIDYYVYAGTYYQVFQSGSKVVYMVVKKPSA